MPAAAEEPGVLGCGEHDAGAGNRRDDGDLQRRARGRPAAVAGAGPEKILAIYEDYRGSRGNVSAGNFVDGVVPVSSFSDVTGLAAVALAASLGPARGAARVDPTKALHTC